MQREKKKMHHVVQTDLFHEYGYTTIINALNEQQVPYTVVKVAPFAQRGDIVEAKYDSDIPYAHNLNIEGKVMVWGSTTHGHIAAEKGWKPGRFQNDNFDMRVLFEKYGANMLSSDAKFCTFGELEYTGMKFIRPVHDSKTFSGVVMDGSGLAEWKKRVLDVTDGYSTLRSDTPVMYASPRNIELEARFFVVNGRVVTGSSYRTLGRQCMYQRIDSLNPLFHPLLRYAQGQVDWWSPDDAFVLDVGVVDGIPYVLEINSINGAGFYACDMNAVVKALENMVQ